MPAEFEHNLLKSISNLAKHGISLADAEDLWLDPNKIYVPARPNEKEFRYALIARYQEKIWHCTFALRQGRYRLISSRRARPKEISAYHRGGV